MSVSKRPISLMSEQASQQLRVWMPQCWFYLADLRKQDDCSNSGITDVQLFIARQCC